MYSVTDRNSFEEVETIYNDTIRVKDEPDFPMVLIGYVKKQIVLIL